MSDYLYILSVKLIQKYYTNFQSFQILALAIIRYELKQNMIATCYLRINN